MTIPGQAIREKQPQAPPNPEYITALHQLPCVICDSFGETQTSKTTAHHWIMGRGSNLRTPDHEALPFCDGHHQGLFDTSKVAIHRERERWAELYGEDHEYIAVTQDRVAREFGVTVP